ncbi:MAG: hypothetical protein V1672_01505 [Candidatus Diapherotrites archaeon]
MKKILFSILIFILMNSAFAMNIEAPTEVPKNVNWILKAELDSENDYDTAEVFLDGDKVVTMYVLPDGSGLIDSFDESVVLKAFVQDEGNLILYVSFLGVSEGNHELKVRELDNGSVFDEQTFEISTFDVLPESYRNEIQEKINNIDNFGNQMTDRISELDKIIESKNSEISTLQSRINELESRYNSEVSGLRTEITELQNELNANKGDLENLYTDFSAIQEIINDQTERGLLSFIFPKTEDKDVVPETIAEETTEETVMNENPTMFAVLPEINSIIIIGILIVVVIIAAFLFIKSRGNGFGSGNSFYSDTEFFGMDDEPHSSGKWAFEGEERKRSKSEMPSAPKSGKRFHMGDLLRKD